MSTAHADWIHSPRDRLEFAQQVLREEGEALLSLADRLGSDFSRAVDVLGGCRGAVILCGIGKAGLIAQKLTATFASTGAPSHFLHPAEAMHGDLGRVTASDSILILSMSGETEEIVRLLPSLVEMKVPIVAMTGAPMSSLGQAANVVLNLGDLREACHLGLAPSTSTTAMLALGDALALVVSRARGFSPRDFARFHPGGSLGRKLTTVEEIMRTSHELRVAYAEQTVRDILRQLRSPGRRSGAVLLVDSEGRLTGIFTDSDLARLLETHQDEAIDKPIANVMTARPKSIGVGASIAEACDLLAAHRISELPVVDREGRLVGMIDITDIVSLVPTRDHWMRRLTQARKRAQSTEEGNEAIVLPFPSNLTSESP